MCPYKGTFRLHQSFRWLYPQGSPLPIPNREVKPNVADGNAVIGVRVGRRPLALFVLYNPISFLFQPQIFTNS